MTQSPTAAILIIGNEVLSGRTPDANLNVLAHKLGGIGLRVKEARVVPDITEEIVTAVNALRRRYTYVFTTGGIGPTHDDITTDAIALAFAVQVSEHPDARKRLEAHYGTTDLNDARLRMACVPEGATLIDNPISAAPGFRIENVYVLAGVPRIMEAMLDGILSTLPHGPAIHVATISAVIQESLIAEDLGRVAEKYPALDVGSYPWFRAGVIGTALVVRGTAESDVRAAADEIQSFVLKNGGLPALP